MKNKKEFDSDFFYEICEHRENYIKNMTQKDVDDCEESISFFNNEKTVQNGQINKLVIVFGVVFLFCFLSIILDSFSQMIVTIPTLIYLFIKIKRGFFMISVYDNEIEDLRDMIYRYYYDN